MQPFITVDSASAELILHASRPVEVRDPSGKRIGQVAPAMPELTPEIIALVKERKKISKRGYTTQEVIQHLESLNASDSAREGAVRQ